MGGRGASSGKNGENTSKVQLEDVLSEYTKNVTPGIGKVTKDDDLQIDKHEAEIAFAQWIHDTYGGDIHIYQEHSGQKNPDYLWNGTLWDYKEVSSESSVKDAIKRGHKQIKSNMGGLMLDFGNKLFSEKKITNAISDKAKWYEDGIGDIMIISHGQTVKIIRGKKKK